MAGKKKDGESNKLHLKSWEYLQDSDQARGLIENMIKMGSPIVDRGGVMSYLVYDKLGIHSNVMTEKNLRAELDETSMYFVKRRVPYLDADDKPIRDADGKPMYAYKPVIERIPKPVIDTAFGLRDKGLWSLRGSLSYPIINKNGLYALYNGLYWKDVDIKGFTVKKPVFNLYDGYDPVSEYFFAVPERVTKELTGIENLVPTAAEVKAAVEFIDFFLTDFMFATESAKASAIAFMLSMICREIIGQASVPMLEIRAPEPRSGKSLLAKMMLAGITGEEYISGFTPVFKNIEEFEKELFSQLLQGKSFVFMDDVQGKVQSAFLDMALTMGYVHKRILNTNIEGTVYSGMPFVMTANNPSISPDIVNRIYLLDILKPVDNKQYYHIGKEKAAVEMGPMLLKSLFILYNHWDKTCKRELFREKCIAGFEEWSGVIGGILQAAGIRGFLDDTHQQIKEIDPKQEQAADMASIWYAKHGNAWIHVKDAVDFALKAGYVKEADSTQAKVQAIAARLAKFRKVRLPGGYQFERNPNVEKERGSQWRVIKDAGTDTK